MSDKSSEIDWKNFPDAEARLEQLRGRDLEVANIAMGLQMRARISQLENENAQLRAMESVWLTNRTGRLYFMIPRSLLRVFRRLTSRQ